MEQHSPVQRVHEEKTWGLIGVREKQASKNWKRATKRCRSDYPIKLKFFNRYYFPKCGLTFCMMYGICPRKACSWLVEELGPAGQKMKKLGWSRR